MTSTFPTFRSERMVAVDRGRELGAAWRTEIWGAFAAYLELFQAHGATADQVRSWSMRAIDRLADWAPDLADEIAGVAGGASLKLWQVGAINARTEIIAAARIAGAAGETETECSTAVTLPGNGSPPRTIQTWDWNERMRETPVVLAYDLTPDHSVRALSEFGMVGKIGVNSAGLGVHFNILRHASDHEEIGVPVHAVARRILDGATDIEQAEEIARSAELSASTVLTVVTFDGTRGRVRGLELAPAGVGTVDADDDGVYVHTNHFLDPSLSDGERLAPERPNTYDRLKHLRSRAEELGSAELMDRVEAMRCHADDGAPVCAHASADDPFELRSETLATVSLDVAGFRLSVHRGGPCQVTADTWQVV
ncbi:C45 family autoproteolytic acyltransferase/hydolase [Phytoactinopolyspora halotolerans]|uniref:Peptidase C45 n=1 Tax=Phytoactinopolyspora halotolerans TaxID=1981512 RepID=A0A6L9S6N5_9ACTN|nr:C45 family peptidase [Phytoactinopolyspora halotolerans]NEE00198.1 peptidase C45 [Phytoactinopolyspora halotolerans]